VLVYFDDQIQPGTLEYAIDYLVNNEIDLSCFESRYTGADVAYGLIDNADQLPARAFGAELLMHLILLPIRKVTPWSL